MSATTTTRPDTPPITSTPGNRPEPRITIRVLGGPVPGGQEVLTPEALAFVALLHDRFLGRRQELLQQRQERRARFADGMDPCFRPETAHIREDPSWRVAGAGPGLEDRRVEITGPTDRKMTVNALNSGARVWLADLEDATSPTWRNIVRGQVNLRDAIRGQVDFVSDEGKAYRVGEQTPTIVMRPRGWHMVEKHLEVVDRDGRTVPAVASLVDAGLYLFHNARALVDAGRGPYLYLAKLESAEEARLWNDVFVMTQEHLGLPRGTIRATVLIETITAAFEMEEILWELREHCAGLNAGRWDYIFSIVKNFRTRGRRFVLPDRSQLSMAVPLMRAYTDLLVATCHRRGAHAIGGMSAFIPNRRRPEVTERALAAVRADKEREAAAGFDGTWVAHPDLVPVARAVFDGVLGERPHQVDRQRDDVRVSAADLLDIASAGGEVTDDGVRANVSVALRYLEAWLRGIGAVALDDLMEDAATAEISRSQLWQWIRHGVTTREGTVVTADLVRGLLRESLERVEQPDGHRFAEASELLADLVLGEGFPTFLTTLAYPRHLVEPSADLPS